MTPARWRQAFHDLCEEVESVASRCRGRGVHEGVPYELRLRRRGRLLTIRVAGRTRHRFTVVRLDPSRPQSRIALGDADFDRELAVVSRSPQETADYLADPYRRRALRKLFELGFTQARLGRRGWEVTRHELPTATELAAALSHVATLVGGLPGFLPLFGVASLRRAEHLRRIVVGSGVALLAAGLSTAAVGLILYPPLDIAVVLRRGLLVAATAFVLLFALGTAVLAPLRPFPLRSWLRATVLTVLGLPGLVCGGALLWNGLAGSGGPAAHSGRVVALWSVAGPLPCVVRITRDGTPRGDTWLGIRAGTCRHLAVGQRVVLLARSGRLGFDRVTETRPLRGGIAG